MRQTLDHLLFINNLKLYAKSERELDLLGFAGLEDGKDGLNGGN